MDDMNLKIPKKNAMISFEPSQKKKEESSIKSDMFQFVSLAKKIAQCVCVFFPPPLLAGARAERCQNWITGLSLQQQKNCLLVTESLFCMHDLQLT